MMPVPKIGISGFGTVGSRIMRVALANNLTIKAINDPFITGKQILALLKSDPLYGRFEGEVWMENDFTLVVDGMAIKATGKLQPEDIPWEEEYEVDVVIETTAAYKTKDYAGRHRVKKVIVTMPWVDDTDARIFIAGITTDIVETASDR